MDRSVPSLILSSISEYLSTIAFFGSDHMWLKSVLYLFIMTLKLVSFLLSFLRTTNAMEYCCKKRRIMRNVKNESQKIYLDISLNNNSKFVIIFFYTFDLKTIGSIGLPPVGFIMTPLEFSIFCLH